MSRRSLALLALVLLLASLGIWQQWHAWHAPREGVLRGETMGTTYSVRVVGRRAGPRPDVPALREAVEARLREVNAALSTWDPQSELSRLNAAPSGQLVPVGPAVRTVLGAALELSAGTGGAFDPTVGPLVNLWGFGPATPQGNPSDAAVAAVKQRVGWQHVQLDAGGVTKQLDGLAIDLSAIAKGYGVDAVAETLEELGFEDYLVEIGGDLRVRGHNAQGEPWAIGIEQPRADLPQGERLQAVLRMTGGAVATSGTYRRFRAAREGRAHHILDPRTGYPTASDLVSVSVWAQDCMAADGIATALMVMGVAEGLAWVEQRAGVEAYFITVDSDGRFESHPSRGFPALESSRRPAGP